MKKFRFPVLLLMAVAVPAVSPAAADPPLLTKAEATDYKATSRFADVRAFIDELVKRSPFVRVESIGRTAGGFDIPALIVADPPVTSPEQLRQDDRAVIYIQANIHAGEVEGKESCLMLARDIVRTEPKPYLDKFVLLIVPNLNADGNEKIDPENRSYQPGPAEGVGVRTNDWNLDLNRDGMKLESPEISAVVKNVHRRWDPLLFIDCHTTDGSFHREITTYAWGVNPNGDPNIRSYMSDVMMPAVERICEEKYDVLACGYGYFRDDKDPDKGWISMEFEPRFATNYFQLRNRFSILIENNVYADFETRVRANYGLVRSILDYAFEHSDKLRVLAAEADARAVRRGLNPGPDDVFGLAFEYRPLKEPLTVHSYVTEVVPGPWPNRRATDKVEVHTIPYYADGYATRSIPFAAGYLIPTPESRVLDLLLRHGIAVQRLTEPAEIEVETFKIKNFTSAERLYQGHRVNKITGEYVREKIVFPAGTLVVSTAQPLGALAAYLLEPESDDGLVAWNYFDKFLASSWGGATSGMIVPVRRMLQPAVLPVETVR